MIRIRALLGAVLIALVIMLVQISAGVRADLLNSRSVQILDSKSSAITEYIASFEVPSATSVGSMVLEFCENSPIFSVACVAPIGMDISGASLDFESGETGFSIDGSSTANRLVLTRAASVTVPGPAQYIFSNVINPSSDNQTVYVRISLHGSADGTGPSTDEGAAAFSTAAALTTTAYVPPILIFCTGITVAPDCSSASGFFINLGELSATAPRVGTSQYAGATNDNTGFSVSVHGITMTSGNDVIPALTVPTTNNPGASQFGINLRDNSLPDVGTNSTGIGSSAATADYNIPNRFKFVSGNIISSTNMPSHFNVFTVSYLVNISEDQAPGIYNATYTYIATASF